MTRNYLTVNIEIFDYDMRAFVYYSILLCSIYKRFNYVNMIYCCKIDIKSMVLLNYKFKKCVDYLHVFVKNYYSVMFPSSEYIRR